MPVALMYAFILDLFREAVWPPVSPNLWQTFCRANTIQARPGLAILKQTRMPWVLCECGFISNAGDADIMKHHPESIANAIAEGVRDFTAQELV